MLRIRADTRDTWRHLSSAILCASARDMPLRERVGWMYIKTEKPQLHAEASVIGWRRPTFPQVDAVSSALRGLTSLFGMGRGGPPRYSHHVFLDMS